MKRTCKGIILLTIIGCFACGCFADEITGTTEITGYYQQYHNFSFEAGGRNFGFDWDFAPTSLSGGGFSVAQNLADWFAIWTELSIYGRVEQQPTSGYERSVRLINNLQGIRYQTRQYGPLRLYVKAGAGIAWYGLNLYYPGVGYVDMSGTKFSAGYGGGASIWLHKNIGITLEVSQVLNALPNLTDTDDREKFDSGMVYRTGLTFRF